MFTVKEVSEILDISPHTLRFYDNEGLLPGLTKRNKRRLFSYDDLEWVYNIQCWRETGMSLADIRRYIEAAMEGESTLEERYNLILNQRDKVVEDIKTMKARLKLLERKTHWYQDLMRGADPNKWRPNMRALVKKAQENGKLKTKVAV